MLAAALLCGTCALGAGRPGYAQQVSVPSWIPAGQSSAAGMSAADAARVRAQRNAIAAQAEFFGYDLLLAGWQSTQAFCPESPGYLLLHYRRTGRNGAESLFTAVVPRRSGRVEVVPVLYRNATPFQSAVGSERSLSVFNKVIPQDVAERELQSGGSWLQLGLCYAEIAGDEPRVPPETGTNPALLRAPAPTLRISDENHTTTVLFADQNSAHRYTVWTIGFDAHGRAVSATADSLADYAAPVVNGKAPSEKPLPSGDQPKIIPLPPASVPQAHPLPR